MSGGLRHLRWIGRHPLGRRRPLAARLEWLAWQLRSRLLRRRDFPWVLGLRVAAAPGLRGMTTNIGVGLADLEGMGFLLHFLRPGDLFVDVGANAGSYSLLAARRGATVLAVEPNAHPRAFLERSLRLNGLQATVEPRALDARPGVVVMDLRGDATGHLVERPGPGTEEIAASTLDLLVASGRPRLLKIDVEGAEARVLDGGAATLAATEALLIESWGEPVLHARLLAAGFREASYDPFTHRLSPWRPPPQAQNVLFLRDPEAAARDLAAAAPLDLRGVTL